MRLAVVGAGPVGLASAAVYALAGHRVTLVERDPGRLATLRAGRLPFHEDGLQRAWVNLSGSVEIVSALAAVPAPDLVVCCVGTPSLPTGASDLAQIDAVVTAMADLERSVLVVRSTVPPGTGQYFLPRLRAMGHGYVSHPEFLQEGTALQDSVAPNRLIAGVEDPALAESVFALYPGAHCPRLVVDVTTAELVKIASNAHLAMRISFINEMALLAERVGADIGRVADGMGLDPRIGPAYLRAGLGYGGSCFPKDVRALAALSQSLGMHSQMLQAVMDLNARLPLEMTQRLEARLGDLAGRRIAIWGLAFKPGTDDTRESQAVRLAECLCARGAEVRVHDPVAGCPGHLDGATSYDDALEAIERAEALVLATEWPDYRQMEPASVAERMAAPRFVLDARNALPARAWESAGLEYRGVGRQGARAGVGV